MKPDVSNDQLLVRDIKNNNVSGFDALYWKYHSAVYTNIIKLVKDRDTAKDILQEVFIALWMKRNTLDPGVNIAGWLFTTSYRKCIDHLRRSVAAPFFTGALNIADELPDYRKEKEQESRFRLVQQAVSRLSPQKRKVFELCKLKGKTYEETAQELNISKHTVKEYLTASMDFVKDYIHAQPPQSMISLLLILSVLYPPLF
jgi:RNA polymerase sigma-70 factor (ECF subfamily)